MNKVLQIVSWLEGRKTYIVSGLSTLDGLVQLAQGHHWGQVLPFLFAGAFGGALRAAIAKLEAKLPADLQPEAQAVVNAVENKK